MLAGHCPEREGWRPRTELQDKPLSWWVEESTWRRQGETGVRGKEKEGEGGRGTWGSGRNVPQQECNLNQSVSSSRFGE